MSTNNLYEILGVNKNATNEEIKKAYKNLAKKYHPDSHLNETDNDEKFKKINEAYSILSNEEKRKQYDRPRKPIKIIFPSDINITFNVSFLEIKKGFTKKIKYDKRILCSTCEGFGYESNSSFQECPHCNGKGVINQVIDTPIGKMNMNHPCLNCNATGQILKSVCHKCNGSCIEVKKVEEEITIPNNYTLPIFSIKNLGNESHYGIANLNIKIIKKEEKDLTVDLKNNLLYSLNITLKEAIFGFEKYINVLEDSFLLEEKNVKINQNKIIKNAGFGYGSDLIINYNILIPNKEDFEKEFILLN